MKKIYFGLVLLAVMCSNEIQAQVDRQLVVIQENWTDDPSAAGASEGTAWWQDNYSDDFKGLPKGEILMYGEVTSSFSNKEVAKENDLLGDKYDGGPGRMFPDFWMDGKYVANQSTYLTAMDDYVTAEAVKSNFTIDLALTKPSSSFNVKVDIKKEADFTNKNMVLQVVVKEDDIDFIWEASFGKPLDKIDNIARDIIPNQKGTAIDVATMNTDGNISNSFKINLDASWNKNNCTIVAYLQDADTREFLQANRVKLGGNVSVKEVNAANAKINVYPNPNNGTFNVKNVMGAELVIYDLTGKKVYTNKQCASNNLRIGSLNKGSYIMQVSKDNTQQTLKVIVL